MQIEDLENRFKFHPAGTTEKKLTHEAIRAGCFILANMFNNEMPDCREKDLAVAKVEEVMFWANAGVARS